MLVLVAYDVSTVQLAGQRRLRRIAQVCENFGQRVQKSVFECRVGSMQWVALRSQLLEEMNPQEDSLRFYFMDQDMRIEHHGCAAPRDLEGPLIV